MFFNCIGTKRALAAKIIELFPKHDCYIEPCFRSGAVFFAKPLTANNILNDIDSEVFNLWNVFFNRKEDLIQLVQNTPIHHLIFQALRKQQKDELWQAFAFLYLSTYGFMSDHQTIRLKTQANTKKNLIEKMRATAEFLLQCNDLQFQNKDIRLFFDTFQIRNADTCFAYVDPPYINTNNNYNAPAWGGNDLCETIEKMNSKGIKYMISEFDSEPVLDIAKAYKLNTYTIGERKNLRNRRTEIVLCNYIPAIYSNQLKIDF